MGLALFTFLLVFAALCHLWLQVFNRWVICIEDGPWKPVAFAMWLLASIGLPAGALVIWWDTALVRSALSWQPEGSGARLLFAAFSILWLYSLWRFGAWVMERMSPSQSRRHVLEQISIPDLPRPRSHMPRLLRPFETTFDLHVIDREIEVPCLPAEFDGLVIAHVADIHYNPRHGRHQWFEQIAAIVSARRADVLVFSGDFINSARYIERSVRLHARMKGQLATLAVLGNHDYWTDPAAVREQCARHGIRLMHNKRWTLERAGRRLIFAGTDAPWGGRRTPFARLLARQRHEALILLSHTPDNAPVAAKCGANLVLSGHNHGGQLCLPGIGPVVVPSRFGHRYVGGVYDVGPDCVLNVSRGIGISEDGWGGRMLCPPELLFLTLRSPAVEATIRVPDRTLRARVREDIVPGMG